MNLVAAKAIIDGGQTLQDLLIGRSGGQRRAATFIDQAADGRALLFGFDVGHIGEAYDQSY